MKKVIVLILSLTFVLALAGCGKTTGSGDPVAGGADMPNVGNNEVIQMETAQPAQMEIPSMSEVSQMEYSEVNEALTGKDIQMIRDAWGEPVKSNNKEDAWKLDESMLLFITYNDTGIIESCELICGTPLAPTDIPDDFSFALVWNCYGISSYDSQTGKLVKTTDATNPEDYITYYQLTDEDIEYIYNLLVSLDAKTYPDIYDPKSGMSEPPMTLILTIRENGEVKTIKAENISLTFKSEDEKGKYFFLFAKIFVDCLQQPMNGKRCLPTRNYTNKSTCKFQLVI